MKIVITLLLLTMSCTMRSDEMISEDLSNYAGYCNNFLHEEYRMYYEAHPSKR